MTKLQLARERLHGDALIALRAFVADKIRRPDIETDMKAILRWENEMPNVMLKQLARNWKMTERARGERTAY